MASSILSDLAQQGVWSAGAQNELAGAVLSCTKRHRQAFVPGWHRRVVLVPLTPQCTSGAPLKNTTP